MTTFDREGDEAQGYEDARNGFPRTSTRPFYRRGYDRGLTETAILDSDDKHATDAERDVGTYFLAARP